MTISASTLTIDELARILAECAGEDGELAGDIHDVDFDALGYDSLAIIETAAQIKRRHGVEIPDQLVAELRTPRELLDAVNGRRSGS